MNKTLTAMLLAGGASFVSLTAHADPSCVRLPDSVGVENLEVADIVPNTVEYCAGTTGHYVCAERTSQRRDMAECINVKTGERHPARIVTIDGTPSLQVMPPRRKAVRK